MAEQGLWSSEQHAWLGTMGLTVYAQASTISWPPAPVARAAPQFENLPATTPPRRSAPPALNPATATATATAPVQRAAVAPTVQRPFMPDEPAPAAARPARRAGGRLATMPDRLMLALLRASGQNPADPATQALMAGWPLQELRTNPAAKRALWPQLRALRGQRPHPGR